MCVCLFFLSGAIIIIVVCQPLGSKAFYFNHSHLCVSTCAGTFVQRVCTYCYFSSSSFFTFSLHSYHQKSHHCLSSVCLKHHGCVFVCALLYKLNVIEIVILPIEFGRRPILLGHTNDCFIFCFSFFMQMEWNICELFSSATIQIPPE